MIFYRKIKGEYYPFSFDEWDVKRSYEEAKHGLPEPLNDSDVVKVYTKYMGNALFARKDQMSYENLVHTPKLAKALNLDAMRGIRTYTAEEIEQIKFLIKLDIPEPKKFISKHGLSASYIV